MEGHARTPTAFDRRRLLKTLAAGGAAGLALNLAPRAKALTTGELVNAPVLRPMHAAVYSDQGTVTAIDTNGAVLDVSDTDHSQMFQAAIESLPRHASGGEVLAGGDVIVLPGDYHVRSLRITQPGTRLTGVSQGVVLRQASPGDDVLLLDLEPGETIQRDLAVSNLRMVGAPGSTGSAITNVHAGSAWSGETSSLIIESIIENVTIHNFGTGPGAKPSIHIRNPENHFTMRSVRTSFGGATGALLEGVGQAGRAIIERCSLRGRVGLHLRCESGNFRRPIIRENSFDAPRGPDGPGIGLLLENRSGGFMDHAVMEHNNVEIGPTGNYGVAVGATPQGEPSPYPVANAHVRSWTFNVPVQGPDERGAFVWLANASGATVEKNYFSSAPGVNDFASIRITPGKAGFTTVLRDQHAFQGQQVPILYEAAYPLGIVVEGFSPGLDTTARITARAERAVEPHVKVVLLDAGGGSVRALLPHGVDWSGKDNHPGREILFKRVDDARRNSAVIALAGPRDSLDGADKLALDPGEAVRCLNTGGGAWVTV